MADKAVTPVILMVEPEPVAASVPGSAVAPVSAAQEADEGVGEAATAPDRLVQVVVSAPFMLIVILVAPAEAVLITRRAGPLAPVLRREIRK